jgi:hypothetical protein
MEWNSWEKLLATVRIYFESEDFFWGKRQELGPFFSNYSCGLSYFNLDRAKSKSMPFFLSNWVFGRFVPWVVGGTLITGVDLGGFQQDGV